jgi:prepilin-type N-terminal cleavage/methylation domain-containing protein
MTHLEQRKAGFTLVEILLVLGIIGALMAIVVVSVNPNRQMGQARDVKRKSDINAILNAIYHYRLSNKGKSPGCLSDGDFITGIEYRICKSATHPACALDHRECSLSGLSGSYIPDIPVDPLQSAYARMTGYSIWMESNGRITVSASGEVLGTKSTGYTKPQITITR